ncbi:MAG: TrkA family potassium uptake protein [Acutalibacteraceae bacterium]|nr:TrkA family potassium uptake protein [Acutalibacteraceae bacterium]
MTKNVLLIGLGRFGKHMAMDLNRLGHEVMAVDLNEDRVNEILPYVTNAQIGDSTNEEFLESLGIGNYDLCVVAIGNNFQNSLETTSLLKDMGAKLVVSRAERDVQAKFLLRNGADKVVYPERQMAKWAAIRFTADHILDFIEVDESHAIFEVEMPRQWVGKTVGQLNIRQKYNINIVAIKRGEDINMSISSETMLKEGETLLVIGEYKTLQRCFQM